MNAQLGTSNGERRVGAPTRPFAFPVPRSPFTVRMLSVQRSLFFVPSFVLRSSFFVLTYTPDRPPLFFHEADLANHHRLVDRLHHVVDGQRGDRDGGEGFHFDAGLAGGADGATMSKPARVVVRSTLDVGQRQRMAQRDQLRRALGGHDAGQPRGLQRIAFLDCPAPISRRAVGDIGSCRARPLRARSRASRSRPPSSPALGVDMTEARFHLIPDPGPDPGPSVPSPYRSPAPDRTRGSRATPSGPRSSASHPAAP